MVAIIADVMNVSEEEWRSGGVCSVLLTPHDCLLSVCIWLAYGASLQVQARASNLRVEIAQLRCCEIPIHLHCHDQSLDAVLLGRTLAPIPFLARKPSAHAQEDPNLALELIV